MKKNKGKIILSLGIIVTAFIFLFTIFTKDKKTITKASDDATSEEVFEKTEKIHLSEDSKDLPINIDLNFTKDETSENITLSDENKKATYDIEGTEQTTSMLLKISYSSDGYDGEQTIKAGRLRIEIPGKAFEDRNGEKHFIKEQQQFLNSIDSNGMLEYLEDESTADNLVFTNKDLSAAQISLSVNYDIVAFKIKDKYPYEYKIKITDTETNKDISPEPLTAIFNTHVRDAKLIKSIDDFDASNGSYYKWDDTLTTRYGLEESDLDFENYGYVSYQLSASADVNQESMLYFTDTPENDGEVVAVSKREGTYRMPFEVLEKETTGPYRGYWKYRLVKTTYNGASEYFYVLVKYPRNKIENINGTNASLYNKATVTFVGVDGNEEDVTTAEDDCNSIWQNAYAGGLGDIWGVTKKTDTEDSLGAINLLKKGKDVNFTYTINGIGYTYKYGAFDNFEYTNGPYRIELLDDALYVNGLGDDGLSIQRLAPEDFNFQKFYVYVDHDEVTKVNLKLEPSKWRALEDEEKSNVDVYVMTLDKKGQWQLDQTVDFSEENTTHDLRLKDKGIYRIKFVYNNANGRVNMRVNLTGALKGNSTNIQKVISNIEEKRITNFQLFNWDAMMAYNGQGKWENPVDGTNIATSAPEMKEDLINFDASEYEGHSNLDGEVKIADRRPAQNNLTTLTTFSGGAKKGEIKYSEGKIIANYRLGALSNAGATTEENIKAMISAGIVDDSKEIVFYDLLPVGLKFKKATVMTGDYVGTGYFRDGQFNWDNAAGNSSGDIKPINMETPKVTTKVVSNNYDGTNRQMIKISIKYQDSPIVSMGDNLYGLGAVVDIEAEGEPYEFTSYTLVNNMAAQFLDKNGKPFELEGNSVYKDDGSIFSELKNKSGLNVFRDINNDSNVSKKTVVGADCAINYQQYVAGTELKKKIKADDFDDDFLDYTQTYAGHDYTYRLTFFSDAGKVKNVVLFDSIEEAYGNNPYWKGTLKGVDINEAKEAGFNNIEVYVNTSKYYSFSEMVNDNSTGYKGLTPSDLTEENGWEKINPDTYTSWANVKTIAFSFGEDTVFSNDSSLPMSVHVYLKMTAPKTIHKAQTNTNQVLAYNAPAYYAEKVVGEENNFVSDTTAANTVTIGLKSATADIPSITKSFTGDSFDKDFKDEYEFMITPLDNAPTPHITISNMSIDVKNIKVKINSTNTTATSDLNGTILFTEPGEYSYEITESEGKTEGVGYSKAKYKVVYNVTDERKEIRYDEDTKLKVEMKIYKVNDDNGIEVLENNEVEKIEFSNSYDKPEKEIPESPKTLDNITSYIVILVISLSFLITFIIILNKYRKNA